MADSLTFADRQLPEPPSIPTVTLHAEQLRRFRNTLTECMSFIELATGIAPREQSTMRLAAWLMEHVGVEAAAAYDQLSTMILAGVFCDDD